MGKQPAFMYYPKDWRSDVVWSCSLAARGLWHEMMDRMHESKPYGYLCANGKPIPYEQIARLCGTTLQEFNVLLAELDAVGVPRRTASGIIYSKRMVEDERKRKEWRNRQKKHRIVPRDVTPVSRECHTDLHYAFASSSPELKTNSKPAQKRRGDHTPEQIRQIEAKQSRQQVEAEVHKETNVGAGPWVPGAQLRPEILERIRLRELARSKTM